MVVQASTALEILGTYKNLFIYTTFTFSLTLLVSFLGFPSLFLYGLFTYVHPDNASNPSSIRATIRRPSSDSSPSVDGFQPLSSSTNAELRKRVPRSREKADFDEGNAQIFRIKLDDAHVRSRVYFADYQKVFVLSFLGVCCFALKLYLGGHRGGSEVVGVLENGGVIPVVLGIFAVSRLFMVLMKVSFERSASRRSDKQLSLVLGALGSFVGMLICSSALKSGLDFDLSGIGGLWGVLIAIIMGCLSGFLYMPAAKYARAFWLGTDQIRCNLSIISCGWFSRSILFAAHLLSILAALLWINPFGQLLVNERPGAGSRGHEAIEERLLGNVGMAKQDFIKFRLCCLTAASLMQMIVSRPCLQMYLNEAVLSWYQRLHASRVPDLDFSRAKVFLHNHYICLTVLQFLGPPALALLFLGLSQVDDHTFGKVESLCGQSTCSVAIKQVSVLLAWWVNFIWAAFATITLGFYRSGLLYVS